MTELDQNSNPQLKVEGDRDWSRGWTKAMWPSAVLSQNVSLDTQFECLLGNIPTQARAYP